ncbi:MAG: hypothetical protein ACI8P9_003563 [Parasphingorhabdus sp.]
MLVDAIVPHDYSHKDGYPHTTWDSDYEIQTAKRLEKQFPKEIPKYYLSGLGNLRTNAVRKEYARGRM